jgi:hypothetical protein
MSNESCVCDPDVWAARRRRDELRLAHEAATAELTARRARLRAAEAKRASNESAYQAALKAARVQRDRVLALVERIRVAEAHLTLAETAAQASTTHGHLSTELKLAEDWFGNWSKRRSLKHASTRSTSCRRNPHRECVSRLPRDPAQTPARPHRDAVRARCRRLAYQEDQRHRHQDVPRVLRVATESGTSRCVWGSRRLSRRGVTGSAFLVFLKLALIHVGTNAGVMGVQRWAK